jgi:hypothetical protein
MQRGDVPIIYGTVKAHRQGKGNNAASWHLSLSFLFFSFFFLHPLSCMIGPSLKAIKGKDHYLSRGITIG